jgi:UDPglucose 6-dehydrogenase
MKIGFMGLGKLGLPVALAVESKGHEVYGYDISQKTIDNIKRKKIDYKEIWVDDHLPNSKLQIVNIHELVKNCEIIFVPIQTPHDSKYEGITKIPKERADFDYSFLKSGIETLSKEIENQKKNTVVIIISTVLPGTIRKEIKPLLGNHTKLCYNPFFIAMGSTMRDFLNPEFVLFGIDDQYALELGKKFYRTITNVKLFDTTIENAELIKVAYNTMISTKIAFVNNLMELCHKLPNTNIDDVTNALKLGNRRLISTAYLDGGMGDGGGCHPRDNIAMSYLSTKFNLSHNWFENIMLQREKQTEWLAEMIIEESKELPINILGKTFKSETNLTLGSPAILLKNILEEKNINCNQWDPYVDGNFEQYSDKYEWNKKPQLFFIATKHDYFIKFPFFKGSTILDPWRYIHSQKECKMILIGNSIENTKSSK